MDVNHNNKVGKIDSKSEELNGVCLDGESDGDDESQSLLQPPKKTSLLSSSLHKSGDKPRRKVQWLDKNGTGSQLAQILEFQPSDVSDSDDDESDSCICTIM